MIKVTSLNKWYNKGRSNEIHVINDVNFEFPEKGFITILGKSGSGKTTLLNVISGLDKADSGTISYRNGKKVFEKYEMGKMDTFRIKNIGYIFQNYLIQPEETVFANVDNSLKLCGIQDAKERKIRSNAALKAVGMSKYRRKLCSALSGGQKQRVGIARAIAKLPKIIIADEPTGNLDSENSIEIMRILRDISKNYLVVMVTHNERLAWAFGDRIIRYKDGQIVDDIENTDENRRAIELGRPKAEDTVLYLSDYQKATSKASNVGLEVYSKDPENLAANIQIVERDGKKYLFVDDEDMIINDKSMKIIEKRPEVDLAQEKDLKTSTFDSSEFTMLVRKPIPFFSLLKQNFFGFFNEKRMKTGAFKVLSGILGLGIAVISIVTYFTFFTNEYSRCLQSIETDSVSLSSSSYNITIPRQFSNNDLDKALEDPEASGITGVVASVTVNAYTFGLGAVTGTSDYYACANVRMPQINGENPWPKWGTPATDIDQIMVSTGVINLAMPEFLSRGYSYDYLLGKKFLSSTGTMLYNNSTDATPIITGIVDNSKPYIYLSREGAASSFDAIVANHQTVQSPYGFSRSVSYNLLETIDFKTREEASYETAATEARDERLINVIVSSSALKYFVEDFAVDEMYYNIVGTFDSLENIAVFDTDVDFERYADIEGLDSLYTTRMYSEIPSDLELVSGRLPKKNNEYLVSENNTATDSRIVGRYKTTGHNLGKVYRTLGSVFVFDYSYVKNLPGSYFGKTSENFSKRYVKSFYINDFGKAEAYMKKLDKNYELTWTKDALNNANTTSLQDDSKIIMLATCAGILILMFAVVTLSTRSNMIRQIYTISVFRSLGASRGTVIKMFIAKDLINYLLTMFLGILVTYVGAWVILSSLNLFLPPFWLFLVAVTVSYLLSLLGTMIPLWGLLAKTPTQISTKYDI